MAPRVATSVGRAVRGSGLAALVLLTSLVLCAPAGAATLHTVCASGCDYATLQGALDDSAVVTGDGIVVSIPLESLFQHPARAL